MTISIRLATLQDYPALAQIAGQSQELHAEAHPAIFRTGTPGFTEKDIRKQLESEREVIYVAERQEQMVGYLFALVHDLAYMDIFLPEQRIVVITDIAVLDTARGTGVGNKLFDAAQEWAKSQQATRLELTVWEFNTRARAFYEKRGMQTLSRTMALPLG